MEISPAMEDGVTLPVMGNSQPINVGLYGINDADFSKVKKKLDYGVETNFSEAKRKGKEVEMECIHGFQFNSRSDEKKPQECSAPHFMTSDSVSVQSSGAPTVGFYLLSSGLEGMNQFNGAQLPFMDSKGTNVWANIQNKPITDLNEAPVTTTYLSKIGPNLMHWNGKLGRTLWNQILVMYLMLIRNT